jgi:Family of unknown function (DUF5723)
MFKKSRYLLILLLIVILQDAASQNSQVLYYMNLPQNHLLNPALTPSNSFYLGVPALTGINININNNFVNFSDVIMPNQKGDSLISFLHPSYNVDNFIKKLNAINFISPEINIQLLGMGFRAGKDLFVSLDVTERILGNFALPKDLFVLALKGNNDFLGKTIDLSGLDARLQYFHEFGMGISKNIGSKLRIGVRGKLLFGVANASLNNKSLGLTVNNDYSWDFNANMSASISGPVKVYMSKANKIDSVVFDQEKIKKPAFFANTGNMGLGLDLGAVYQLTGRINISASITDLGFINWKNDVTNLQASSTFKFNGFNITDVANGTKTMDQLAQDMVDSLKNSFTIKNDNQGFRTYLPMGVSVGGSFNLTKSLTLGILSYSRFIGKQIREAVTLSANLNLGNALSTSLSYSMENQNYNNLGAGLALRLGIFQIYFIADKIPVMWNKIVTGSTTIPLPENWNTINLRLGLNLAFGNKEKKKNDRPMLTEQKK